MINIEFLGEIKQPVFVIWGKQDRVLDVSSVGVFKERIANTYAVVMEDTGHAPMIEKPKASAGHYLHFLDDYREKKGLELQVQGAPK